MKYKFTIPGKPRGKQRPRATLSHKQFYTPLQTKQYEAMVRFISLEHAKMLTGPLRVDIIAYFPIPKSYSKARRKRCLSGEEVPTKKPDKDNIEKIILDGLNPLYKINRFTHHREMWTPGFYKDDSQVIAGETKKLYGEPTRVEVIITEL
ncbi:MULTISPECIES: RusA family crossover junction endodeoxyribonuclease [unclassified Lactobacillus]|uniref:RusA family crossover junction endodeoxyribonuclease n=1 Tax=unclassified Lactobacillus TaxID=2620435 RepID=UPI00226A48C1|nr:MULTISPECIES: RusA family crossover junction endodeoxyribonuclease [unclassified Lactobacillus]MCX8721235.1 RusA family crossover junction endodeoxyribonuclease [Lactobacillus sp. B4010]MCX8731939.1 RusA family crossover junction endodeoxyribonuclease [Lactobacillus sp. B4015]MCX8734374.1 RusA family crossover junction endodeoxyribonuclease [Lactobacillus sp. B4012]